MTRFLMITREQGEGGFTHLKLYNFLAMSFQRKSLIKNQPISDNVLRAIMEGLEEKPYSQLLAESLKPTEGHDKQLTVSFPQDVYSMGIDEIIEGKSLDGAHHLGVRVLLSNSLNEAYSAAEVSYKGKQPSLRTIDSSPFLEYIISGIIRFVNDGRVRVAFARADLEPRLLRIPALYITALWFHGSSYDNGVTSSDIDLIIPVGPTYEPFIENRQYSEDEFLALMQQAARKRIEQEPR
ncbi:hypothetical protein FNT36_20730 [Hymenobacter setariae]|uniref:Uncharacterized protein n=1 Tax=Hymenobacter setariae TaxID=2594794 RepID=A0A558BQ18_9BACT|nr:hypothetical protein [Hymenobacter setariae]TVT38607.1 hypothetical protein FNT36_20730 [Hymenobacter setariae]